MLKLFMAFYSIIYAQGQPLPSTNGITTIAASEVLIANILGAILQVGVVVLFVMIVKGGFRYLSSAGNPKQLEAAKKTLTYAVSGMVLAASAYFILQVISDFTGVTSITILDVTI